MSRASRGAAAGALATVLIALEALTHELVHTGINALAAGTVRSCGALGPLTVHEGRLAACLAPGGAPALNALLTPLALATAGLVLMWGSARFERTWVRWGVMMAGAWIWLWETGYGVGWLVPPTLSEGTVSYWGDGVVALEAFGRGMQLPYLFVLVGGVVVLRVRLRYRR